MKCLLQVRLEDPSPAAGTTSLSRGFTGFGQEENWQVAAARS